MQAALIHSDDLSSFEYGDDHPFKPMRARNAMELCVRYGLLSDSDIVRIDPAWTSPEILATFHEQAYLDILDEVDRGEYRLAMLERGIGTEDCPAVPGIRAFSLLATGATMTAVDLVMTGRIRRAFNPVGGFHHAGRDHAEGFCYVNDVGVAITHVVGKGLRVAFVDIDAHHPNGVQDAFYDDDRALVISLHETGDTLYPGRGYESEIGSGRGRGYTVNVPLLERTDDEVYTRAFSRTVPPLLDAFRPDIVIAEVGADTMVSDPLTHLRLTTNGYQEVLRSLCEHSPRLVAVGGGGYDIYRTARCWALAWAAMTDREPVDQYAGLVGGMMYGAEMDGLQDRPLATTGEAKERARAHADRVVGTIEETVFPLIGARKS
jgi:acetoin utilization protein AcuC